MDPNSALSSLQGATSRFLEVLNEGTVPTPREYIAQVRGLDAVAASLVLALGLIVLLQGWRIFRVWVVVAAGAAGVLAGDFVAQFLRGPYVPFLCPVAGGLLLAILAWPLVKYALGLVGGLTGCVLGIGLMRYLAAALGRPEWMRYAWVAAIAGAVLLGAGAFFLFRMVVIVSSSFQGSLMVVSGIVALVLKYGPAREPVSHSLEHGPHVLPALVLVPAIVGMFFQFFWTAPRREPPPEEDE